MFVYVDQNILGRAYAGELSLTPNDSFEWVYSDTHFAELRRGDPALATELLGVLAIARARKINLKLADDWTITDEAIILDFQNPGDLYKQFLDSADEYPKVPSVFNLLLAYLHGNSQALDPNEFANSFGDILRSIVADIPHELLQAEYPEGTDYVISSLSEDLREALESARPHLKPLDKTRRFGLCCDRARGHGDSCLSSPSVGFNTWRTPRLPRQSHRYRTPAHPSSYARSIADR